MAPQRRDHIVHQCQQIAHEFHPDRIILFGSYAYGTPTPWSDVDLLVVMPYAGSARQAAATILQRLRPDFGVDVLVRTPAEVAQRLAMDDSFMHEITSRGQVLNEADHARVG